MSAARHTKRNLGGTAVTNRPNKNSKTFEFLFGLFYLSTNGQVSSSFLQTRVLVSSGLGALLVRFSHECVTKQNRTAQGLQKATTDYPKKHYVRTTTKQTPHPRPPFGGGGT